MDDAKVLSRINELAREEHELFERESHLNVSDADRERLRQIQVTLDQCWDLLRQRRARRAAGLEGACPKSCARPEVCRTRFMRILMVVDLPAPLGPSRP